MILQKNGSDGSVLVISQVAHSWMSGQMAREWGNAQFLGFEPWEHMCYAAEQHDAGYFEWEEHPRWNPATGLPCTFEELPISEHVTVWRRSIRRLQPVSVYAALMTSFHFCRLCAMHDREGSEGDAQVARIFLEEQREYQKELLQRVCEDWSTLFACSEEALARNHKLIAAWDLLSLQLSRNPWKAFEVGEVPQAGQQQYGRLSVSPSEAGERVLHVEPWPFHPARVQLCCEGYLLERPLRSQEDLDDTLTAKRFVRLPIQYVLLPKGETPESSPRAGRP